MSDKPDWDAIRKEYEAGGIAFRALAFKHGVPFGTLYSRSRKWIQTPNKNQTEENQTSNITPLRASRYELPSIPSAVDGANLGIEALVDYLENNAKAMNLMEHVKAATALYQYNRIIVNAAPVDDLDDADLITIDTRDLSAEGLIKIKAFALEMKESQVG